ncbi:MAG: methylmalonyl-CoA mutase subunit beta [Calditrichia bacterium]
MRNKNDQPLENLFDRLSRQFVNATDAEWRSAAEKLLKGKSFEKTLISRTIENISLSPIYGASDVPETFPNANPGEFPFQRGATAGGFFNRNWQIAQEIRANSPRTFNSMLKNDLSRGQNVIHLPLDFATRSAMDPDEIVSAENAVPVSRLDDFSAAIDDVDCSKIPFHIYCGVSNIFISAIIAAEFEKHHRNIAELTGNIAADPIGELATTGQLPTSLNNLYNEIASAGKFFAEHRANVRSWMICADKYHNAGADTVQEIAVALATGAEYLRAMLERGFSADAAIRQITFQIAIGGQFFMEVAKLRTLRMLWGNIARAFGVSETAMEMNIHAVTSQWNKTRYDAHVNMLRATTEAMAAIFGGCNSLQVAPFDELLREPDDFSRRIARNIQLILRDESHLDAVIDPAGGAWYIEKLSDELATAAWQKFRQIEKSGGIIEVLETSSLQQEIEKTATERANRLATGKDRLVGTTRYANAKETVEFFEADTNRSIIEHRKATLDKNHNTGMQVQIDQSRPIESLMRAAQNGATIGQMREAIRESDDAFPRAKPLQIHRAAEAFEFLRLAVERYSGKQEYPLKVLLLNFGELSEYKPRADFARGFLEVAGLQVTDSAAVTSVENSIGEIAESQPKIVVFCASDERYPDFVAELTTSLKAQHPATVVALAGYPQEHIESFSAAGVDEFIHIRSNIVATLRSLLEKSGII